MTTAEKIWVAAGFFGQALFASRFLVQWLASERRKESTVPLAFWYFSIGGGLILLSYAIHRRDPVFIAGQSFGLIVYTRNLMLIAQKRALAGAEPMPLPARVRLGLEIGAVAVILGAAFAHRLWLAQAVPFDIDEIDALHHAYLFAQGWRPFTDHLDARPPLLAALLAPFTAWLGPERLPAFRPAFAVVGAAAAALIYRFARREWGPAAAVATLAIAQANVVFAYTGAAVRPDILVVAGIFGGACLLQSWQRRGGPWRLVLAGVLAGGAIMLKLTPLPVAALMTLWLAMQPATANRTGGWRAGWPVRSRRLGLFAAGMAVPVLHSSAQFPWGFVEGFVWFPALIAEFFGNLQVLVQERNVTLGAVIAREPAVFAAGGAVLAGAAVRTIRRGGWRALPELGTFVPAATLVYLPMLALKRSAHIQDLLLPLTLTAPLMGAAVAWAGQARFWARLPFLRTGAALAAGAALAGQLALASGDFVALKNRHVQANPFVHWARVEACGGAPMEVPRFRACFEDALIHDRNNDRLSLAQQIAGARFFSALLGPGGEALSSNELNIFTLNSHTFGPPRLVIIYPLIRRIYDLLHSGKLPLTSHLVRTFTLGKHFNVWNKPAHALDAALYEELAERSPPAAVQLDQKSLQLYADVPGLMDFLAREYKVVFHPGSALFVALHTRRYPELLERAQALLWPLPADKMVLHAREITRAAGHARTHEALGQALAIDPNHPEAHRMMGVYYTASGKQNLALAHYLQAVANSAGHDLDSILDAAEIHLAMRRPEAALELLGTLPKFYNHPVIAERLGSAFFVRDENLFAYRAQTLLAAARELAAEVAKAGRPD